jgi:hypothetical protein
MATSGSDLLVAAYQALGGEEQDEAFERLHQLRIDKEAGTGSDMARYVRSLRRAAETLGRTPTADEYREVQPRLVEAGEDIESFSRLYRFFGSWPRAREALDLSETTTPRRIEARFRQRKLGKVWRYDDDDLRDALTRAAEHYGYPPSTTEFDWWREREFELARATGREEPHLPSVTPYRKRWGGWEPALLHFGYSEQELARRLTTKNNIIRKGHDPDAWLPAGLPMAGLRDDHPADLALAPEQVVKLRDEYALLARRSRYVLTVRLGLAQEPFTLKQGAEPLGLSLDRVRQLQVLAFDRLTDALASDEAEERGRLRNAVAQTLRALAVAGTT